MSQKNGVSWHVVVLTLITVSLFLGSGTAEAKNPDLSSWTLNLSESAAPAELGENDFAQEIEVVGTTVHVMWITHDKDVWARYKIFYRRSTDNGQTWEAKQLLYTSESLDMDVTYKRMVVTGNTVHIAFNYKGGEGGAGIMCWVTCAPSTTANHLSRSIPLSIPTTSAKPTIGFMTSGWPPPTARSPSAFRNQCNWKVDNQYYILNSDDGGTQFHPAHRLQHHHRQQLEGE